MRPVPAPILKSFEAVLEKRAISPLERANYKKWLRYFLDFCAKYPVPDARPDQVRLFIDKLREKNQTPFQQNQAAHAVSIYFEIQRKGETQGFDSHTSLGSESGTDAKTSSVPEPQQVQERSLSFSSRQETPRAIGRCLFSLFPPAFAAVPQYLVHTTVVSLPLSEPYKQISHIRLLDAPFRTPLFDTGSGLRGSWLGAISPRLIPG